MVSRHLPDVAASLTADFFFYLSYQTRRMTRLATTALTVAFGFSAFALTGCQGDAPEATTEDAAVEEAALNTLTEAEQAEGWQLLFNGQDFEGWRGFAQDSIPS